MTASEPAPSPRRDGGPPSIAERALDVLLYLPAGAVLTALEDMPSTVAKGRARVDQEVHNAKVVGRFAVDIGLRQLKDQIELFAGAGHNVSTPPADRGNARAAARQGPGPGEHRSPSPARPRQTTPARDPEVDRAIPEYDILAASQVVRRLDGLGHDELRAVLRHERATRGRRTILHRAEQLLAPSDRGTSGTDSIA